MTENAALVQICANRECEEPSVQVVGYGCVHEHLEADVVLCRRCYLYLRHLEARGEFVCTKCEDHYCPHRLFRSEPLGLYESSI